MNKAFRRIKFFSSDNLRSLSILCIHNRSKFLFLGMKKNQIIWLQIVYWIFNFFGTVITPNLFFPDKNTFEIKALNLTYFIVGISTFYICYLVIIPYCFKPKKIVSAILVFILSIFCFASLRYCIEEIVLPNTLGFRNYDKETGLLYYFFDNIYNGCLTVFIAGILWLLEKYGLIESQKQQLEIERNQAQIQSLKTQINPHFIFNSLNNIYSLVYQKSDKALPALEGLSELLRYSTKDLEKDFIPLERELGYIESLIELEKLRLKNPELISISKNIENPLLEISPMLLVPFVENAFKHGNFISKGFNLIIIEKDNVLKFHLENFINHHSKDSNSGIGINNVRKRLQLLYPNKNQLMIKENQDTFIVDLEIQLK